MFTYWNPMRDSTSALFWILLSSVAFVRAATPASPKGASSPGHEPGAIWARGIENQRRANLGNGLFLNPILAGDHADPSILKDGDDYYLTHSSFFRYPGLLIWHSKNLVDWQPVGPALKQNVGDVWAPDLVRYKGRYYIYFPALKDGRSLNYVVWADSINGPWSDPIDLHIGQIDPGHAVGSDGRRYLMLSDGYMVGLTDDGLSVTGKMRKVYEGWKYPADWVVGGFALEGPKVVKHGDYYYLIVAEGGTAGPPTSHMVVAARARSLQGPWENSPYNPIVHTRSREERWWSKGHGTLFEGPAGKWYLIYHAYENGFYTLGRQTLLEPVVWTDDGWFKTAEYDVATPIPMPAGPSVASGVGFSDDFSTDKTGVQWSFHQRGNDSNDGRCRRENGSLVMRARGESPKDCSPLTFDAGDQAYQIEVEIEIDDNARAGLILFYNEKLYAGLGFDAKNLIRHRYGVDTKQLLPAGAGKTMWLRLVNDRQIVSLFYSLDGITWMHYPQGMEVSGYHHNVMDEFLSLRPALYAAGQGEVRFRHFIYRALP